MPFTGHAHFQTDPGPAWMGTTVKKSGGNSAVSSSLSMNPPDGADLHVYPVETSTLVMRPLIHRHGTSAFHIVSCSPAPVRALISCCCSVTMTQQQTSAESRTESIKCSFCQGQLTFPVRQVSFNPN